MKKIKELLKGKGLTIAIIFFAILLIIGIITIFNKSKFDNVDVIKTDDTHEYKIPIEEKDEEEKFEDQEIISDITKKFHMILTENASEYNNDYLTGGYFNRKLFTSGFDSDQKLYMALNSLINDFTIATNEEVKAFYESEKILYKYSDKRTYKKITRDQVEERYMSIFGTNVASHKEEEDFSYDSVNRIYYYYKSSEEKSESVVYYNINNFTKDSKYIYMYVSLGEAILDENKIYVLYSGLSDNKKATYIQNIVNLDSFKIDSGNKDNFDIYKLTFAKNNKNEYYYLKREKVQK